MNVSRRDFVKVAAAGAPLARALAKSGNENGSYVDGVQLGVQTYSFHEIPNDGANHADWVIRDMLACGIYECELFASQIEPGVWTTKRPPVSECPDPLLGCAAGKGGSMRNPWAWELTRVTGEELTAGLAKQRKWRETVPMDYFKGIRQQFNKAGIEIFSYNAYFLSSATLDPRQHSALYGADTTDLEFDRTFLAAKTLGAKAINVSTNFTQLKRMVPFAEKHQVIVAPHGHSVTWDPEEFASRESFVRAFALSKWVGANLDIGHYTASGGDPLAFIDEFHDRISNLHLKDRKQNRSSDVEDGMNVPWGEGQTPIKQVLRLLKQKKYQVPAFIEYEYAGTEKPVAEVKKNYRYCLDALKG
jgi:sugar phosphate isomerase/epimerase